MWLTICLDNFLLPLFHNPMTVQVIPYLCSNRRRPASPDSVMSFYGKGVQASIDSILASTSGISINLLLSTILVPFLFTDIDIIISYRSSFSSSPLSPLVPPSSYPPSSYPPSPHCCFTRYRPTRSCRCRHAGRGRKLLRSFTLLLRHRLPLRV